MELSETWLERAAEPDTQSRTACWSFTIAAALAQLPVGERDALLLFAWEELSYEEIAAALVVTVGTVRSRLNRARRRLREPAAPSGEESLTTMISESRRTAS